MSKIYKNKKIRNEYLRDILYLGIAVQVKVNRKARGLSVAKFAKLSKLSIKDVKSIERGCKRDLLVSDVTNMAKAFNCGSYVGFVSAADILEFGSLSDSHRVIPTFEEETKDD